MNFREDGQHSSSDLRGRDFRRELEERERSARDKRGGRDRGLCNYYDPKLFKHGNLSKKDLYFRIKKTSAGKRTRGKLRRRRPC